jgi:nitrogen fixation/metabolism regulation signal transduction histidine kinase
MADEVSNGSLNVQELPVKGSDEIAHLAKSFYRMFHALTNAPGQ